MPSTAPVSPNNLSVQAGLPTSRDKRFETIDETILFSDPRFGTVIRRDVRDITSGEVKDMVIWNRERHFVVNILIAVDPLTRAEAIWVKQEFKNGVMDYVTTSTAGGIKKGEEPADAALRELAAEFGIIPVQIRAITGRLFESPDKTTGSSQTIFLSQGIKTSTDKREEGAIQKFPLTREGVQSLLTSTSVVLHRLAIYEALRATGNAKLLG